MMGFLVLLVIGAGFWLLVVPLIALARANRAAGQIRTLEDRVRRLEAASAPPPSPVAAANIVTPVPPMPSVPPPASVTMPASVRAPIAPPPGPPVAPVIESTAAPLATPVARWSEPAPLGPAPPEAQDMEQMVGGIWLQNAGAVLVLVGVFFMILWGWSTGRFGPGVLVAAGVVLGLGIAWRGDRTARTLPNIGHALVGVGLGVMYLALYLGHFRLHVLSTPFAFGALIGTSGLTLVAGLHYGVQGIAALGVIGAFLPQALAELVSLQGFRLPPGALLGYLGAVDVLVFGLAARSGWSGLALTAVFLSTVSWIGNVPRGDWTWPLEIGLCGLFVALGLAPIPRLTRVEGPVRVSDLALVSVTPMALVACSWPMWAMARSEHVAMLLLTLAVIYLVAALWVDGQRPERDLWRPLTGAATVFLTAALQRAVGVDSTPMAWTVEGAVLMVLGLAPRAGWLRVCGYVVTAIGMTWTIGELFGGWGMPHPLPVWNPDAIRSAVAIGALLAAALMLRANRHRLTMLETTMANLWTGFANVAILLWVGREATHLAWSVAGPNGRWNRLPSIQSPAGEIRPMAMAACIAAVAFVLHAFVLVRSSWPSSPERSWPFLRFLGHVVAGIAWVVLLASLLIPDGWGLDRLPIVHLDGLLSVAAIAGLCLLSLWFAARRAGLTDFERHASEAWALAAGIAFMTWIGREADHVARFALDIPGEHSTALRSGVPGYGQLRSLIPALTSVGWLFQAMITLALGWRRRSPFLRWMGLALVGFTAIKILVVDLASADPFWRFLAAILAGVVMLGVSYAYQRRKKRDDSGLRA